jgi:glycolate oxidase FAD binding subunit
VRELGILGLITEVSIKVLPKPRAELTLRLGMATTQAIERFNRWSGRPLPISASAWHDGSAYLRLSGAASAIQAARSTIGGEVVEEANAAPWWQSVRDQTLDLFRTNRPLWRVSLPSAAPFEVPGIELIEWAGALRWLCSDLPSSQIRAAATRAGGSAALWRGRRDTTMFHPLAASSLALHRRLKQQFDPNGIFNPGRMIEDL